MSAIARLDVRGFRNLAPQTLTLGPSFNVLAGDNGQGKTNVLEAIYVVATSRSFRTSMLEDLVAHGSEACRVRARVRDERLDERLGDYGPTREQALAIVGKRRSVQVDGKRPKTLASYAIATPVVLFEPASLVLSQGPSAERRKLLDRVAVHVAARTGGADALVHDAERYRRAHLQRKRALERGGDPRSLDAFEAVMAEHGARIVRARASAARALAPYAESVFTEIARSGLTLSIAYAPRAPDDASAFASILAARRTEDARRGSATAGPHLDDMSISMSGHPARKVASQGQHRAIVLALKGAELETIRAARDVEPILLLDDVSSELDPSRNAALFRFLDVRRGQVVVTTTRPELVAISGTRSDFRVTAGTVEPT